MIQRPRAGASETSLGLILNRLLQLFLEVGQRKRIEELLSEFHALAESTRQVNTRLADMRWQAIKATLDGRLEEGVDIIHRMQAMGSETGLTEHVRIHILGGPYRALLEFGQAEEALRIAQEAAVTQVSLDRIALIQSHLNRRDEAAEILGKLVPANPEVGSSRVETSFSTDLNLLEAATVSGHQQATARLLERFKGGSAPPFDYLGLTCAFRLLGEAKALVGNYEEARTDYKEALRVSTEFRFRPEIALTRLGLAELLLERYPAEKKEALEHLDFAIKEFREMKMQPSLERALRQKDILKA